MTRYEPEVTMPKFSEPTEPAQRGIDDSPFSAAVTARRRDTVGMVGTALKTDSVALAYQPIMRADGAQDRPAFYEGLIRVLDDERRVIPAADFIDKVETMELGREIDCTALRLGLEALSDTPDLRLSINMSARSIAYPRWMQTLDYGLGRDPTVAERLILEITERSAMNMPEIVTVFMRDLRHRGIAFAMDDFGGGFTSFR